MDNFTFLKNLNEQVAQKAADAGKIVRPKLTEGIKYEEYEITMFDDKVKTVYVPARRTDIFESEMEKADLLTDVTVRSILRKCNGVTEI